MWKIFTAAILINGAPPLVLPVDNRVYVTLEECLEGMLDATVTAVNRPPLSDDEEAGIQAIGYWCLRGRTQPASNPSVELFWQIS